MRHGHNITASLFLEMVVRARHAPQRPALFLQARDNLATVPEKTILK
jgi:hypothetical protein